VGESAVNHHDNPYVGVREEMPEILRVFKDHFGGSMGD
jgi:hypothetical protein